MHGGHRIEVALVVALLAAAAWFRLWHLSTMPGVSGDEGWWGVNGLAWLNGRPYEARTTSGNPTDLFFLVPVAAVHALGPPSFWLLRIVPAAVNLLALPIGFWFVRRIYGSTTAWIYTVALAVAPTAIAHSRLCQDPSQSIFWAGLVVYLSLIACRRPSSWLSLVAAMVVLPVALWTHPTNVFVAPFLVLAGIAVMGPRLPAPPRGRATLFAAASVAALAVGLIAWPMILRVEASNDFLHRPWLAQAAARLIDPAQWMEFIINTARLFNGVTVYHYFSGARPWTPPYDAGFVLVALLVLRGLWIARLERGRTATELDEASASTPALDAALLAASAAGLLLFFAFAGPKSLRPSAERWGLWLIVPGTLVLARGAAAWIEMRPRLRGIAIAAVGFAAAALLASFYVNYFREFATSGGRAHLTYITAPIEPKQQALAHILAASAGDRPIVIVSLEWWLYWPIAYLATPHPNVSMAKSLPPDVEGFREALSAGRVFIVEFAGTPELGTALGWVRASGLRFTQSSVPDASGRELLAILQVNGPG